MPKKVLLADDSATIHRVVELTFAGEDVSVVSVADGEQAVAAIRQSPPDLVLADIGMPGRTGYEVVEFVRSQPALGSLPVLLLAGAFEPVDEARARRVGADGILTKPFDPSVLVGRVRELLASGRGAAPLTIGPASATLPAFRATAASPDRGAAPLSTAPAAVGESRPSWSRDQSSTGAPSDAQTTPEPLGPKPSADTDRYFAEIDEAFAALSKRPRPPVPPSAEGPATSRPEPASTDVRAETPPHPVPLTDAFAAMLEAERTGVDLSIPPATPSTPAIDLNALADQIARRVLEQLSDRVVREAVAEIVGATAERVVREEIEQIKRNIK